MNSVVFLYASGLVLFCLKTCYITGLLLVYRFGMFIGLFLCWHVLCFKGHFVFVFLIFFPSVDFSVNSRYPRINNEYNRKRKNWKSGRASWPCGRTTKKGSCLGVAWVTRSLKKICYCYCCHSSCQPGYLRLKYIKHMLINPDS